MVPCEACRGDRRRAGEGAGGDRPMRGTGNTRPTSTPRVFHSPGWERNTQIADQQIALPLISSSGTEHTGSQAALSTRAAAREWRGYERRVRVAIEKWQACPARAEGKKCYARLILDKQASVTLRRCWPMAT